MDLSRSIFSDSNEIDELPRILSKLVNLSRDEYLFKSIVSKSNETIEPKLLSTSHHGSESSY